MAKYKKVCPIDGTPFESSRRDSKYCSPACRKKANRKPSPEISVTSQVLGPPTEEELVPVTATDTDPQSILEVPAAEKSEELTAEQEAALAETAVPKKIVAEGKPSKGKEPVNPLTKARSDRIGRMNARLRAKGLPLILDGPEVFHFVRTGIEPLDKLTAAVDLEGVGGLPRKRITEIYGPKGAGKSSLIKTILKNNEGLRVLFFDAEGGMMGAPDNMEVVKGNVVEEIMPALIDAVNSKEYDLIMVDSIASLVTLKQFDGDPEGKAAMARAFGPFIKQLVAHLQPLVDGLPDPDPGTAVVFVNQFRSTTQSFGVMEYTVGGKSMEYYASLRLEFRSATKDHIIRDGKLAGQQVRVKVEKTRFGPKLEEFRFPLMFDELRDYNEVYLAKLRELGLKK